MLKDILAVVVGFAAWSILWLGGNPQVPKLFPGSLKKDGSLHHTGALLTLLVFAALVSIAAGYVVTLVSASANTNLPLILGVILLLVGIVVQRQYWKLMPLWYHLLFLGLLVPATLFGASLG